MKGIFFSEGDARAAALVLRNGGYAADVVRDRLAGEDDDEDHPWAVITDAPGIQLEVLVETYDGWLDFDEPESTPLDPSVAPLPLPDQPRRIKRG